MSATEKAHTRIQRCLNTTLKFHNDKLNLLLNSIVIIDSFFTLQTFEYRPHILSMTSPQGSDVKLDEKRRRCLELANLHDGITTISFDLWSELGEVIRNLMIANYSSIYRSLRWIIETIAFWRDMEKDNENAKDRFSYYFNKESPMTKRRFSYLYKHILDTSIIEDRLKFKQKYLKKNYSFEDMVRNGHTSKSKSVNKVLDIIIENYKKLYGEFSSVSHVSLRSLIETEKENPEDYLN
jgi:hypothetical protein